MARRRIKVAEFRGEDIEIEFPDGNVYPIRGDLPMDIVMFLDQLEEEAVDEDDLKWFQDGVDLITRLVREKTPTFEPPPFSPQELLGLMGAIVGGESVGQALVAALKEGLPDTDPPGPALKRPADRKRSTTKKRAATKKRPAASRRAKR